MTPFLIRVFQLLLISLFSNLAYASKDIKDYPFPPLTGTHAIGTKIFSWSDKERLLIQACYPRKASPEVAKYPYANYEALKVQKQDLEKNLIAKSSKLKKLDHIYIHGVKNASSDKKQGPYPVLIFAQGFGTSLGDYSYLCEQLASHGYVVFTYMNALALDREKNYELIEEGLADIKFMIDQLLSDKTKDKSEDKSEKLIKISDLKRIGVLGHSLGGILASQLCRRDERVKACISLDGPLYGLDYAKPFHKPFMFMQADNFFDWSTNEYNAFKHE